VNLLVSKELARAAPLLAFDTWLGQKDHGDYNPHNIILGYDTEQPSACELVFIDYAYSTGFDGSWEDGRWKDVKPAPFPRLIQRSLDRDLLRATIDKIEALPETAICSVVDRLEDFWMPREQRERVKEGLLGRRIALREGLSTAMKRS
jgi:hypothetical protein